MKKLCTLTLVLVMLLLPMLSLTSCLESKYESYTYTGVVAFTYQYYSRCVIHLSPIGEDVDTAPLFPFFADKYTEMESDCEAYDIANSPELAIGNTIEIVYTRRRYERGGMYSMAGEYTVSTEFHIDSIKSVDPDTVDFSLLEYPLAANPDYTPFTIESRDSVENKWEDRLGKVTHIAKIDYPRKGYLIYTDYSSHMFYEHPCYWIDENTTISEEMLEILDTRDNIGERIHLHIIVGDSYLPFEGIDILFVDKVYRENYKK